MTFIDDLIALQRSLKPITRNAISDDGTPYADIEAIWTYIRPRLAKHRFAVMQWEGADFVRTTLLHSSGESHSDTAKTDQSASGPTRYGRRHALMCLLGIVEAPIVPTRADLTKTDLLIDAYGARTIDVAEAFYRYKIGRAQQIVIVRRCPNADEAIAEAKKLGGAK